MIETIISVVIGMFIYNIFLTTIGNVIIKAAFGNKETEQIIKKTFDERIEELKKQQNND